MNDLRYAVRSLAKSPGFTAAAVGTLALGIGANIAVFAVADAVLLRPLPYADPGRLVLAQTIQAESRQPWGTAPPDFYALRRLNRTLEGLASFFGRPHNLTGADEPDRVQAMVVSSNYFAVLGRKPALGRSFTMADEEWGAHRVAIVSDGLWRRRFGGDTTVLGRTIRLDSVPYSVVGVLPPGRLLGSADAQLFLPMAFAPGDNLNTHNNYFLTMVGRLKAGVSRQVAEDDLNAVMAAIEREHPENKGLAAGLTPLSEAIVQGARPAILVLMGAVGSVLLIACANLANLFLARALGRRREVAIRSALGAGRRRLARQFLTEGALLAGLGGGGGVLMAAWSLGALRLIPPAALPRGDEIRMDARVLVFALGLSALTGILFALTPAIRGARIDIQRALKERAGAAGETGGSPRLRAALVVAEIALSLVLLVGAGLMLKTVGRLLRVDGGFDPRGLLTAEISLPRQKYVDEALERAFRPEACARAAQFLDSVVERVGALPGVVAAGFASSLPLAGENWGKYVTFYDRPLPANARDLPPIQYRVIAGDYFRAAGIRIIRGRALERRDALGAPPSAIVSRELVRLYWSGQDPIGKTLSVNPPRELVPAGTLPPEYPGPEKFTVVGVAADVRYGGLDRAPVPLVYVPYAQGAEGTTTLFLTVKASGDPLALAGAIRGQISEVDRDQPIAGFATMESRVAASVLAPRLLTLLLEAFAAVAALLAAVGIYGVVWSAVRQRTAEIGIRMALGAEPAQVVREVLGQGLRLTAAGIAIGLVGAFAASRALSSLLFGVGPADPSTYAVVALILAGTALASSYLPARRAARVNPINALRAE
jgi:putative ABC transport system permease protein